MTQLAELLGDATEQTPVSAPTAARIIAVASALAWCFVLGLIFSLL